MFFVTMNLYVAGSSFVDSFLLGPYKTRQEAWEAFRALELTPEEKRPAWVTEKLLNGHTGKGDKMVFEITEVKAVLKVVEVPTYEDVK